MNDMDEVTCALWWWTHSSLRVSFFTTEGKAALMAVEIMNGERGYVDGVQFNDGRNVSLDNWELFDTIRNGEELFPRMRQSDSGELLDVKSPFTNAAIELSGPVPDWLGAK